MDYFIMYLAPIFLSQKGGSAFVLRVFLVIKVFILHTEKAAKVFQCFQAPLTG